VFPACWFQSPMSGEAVRGWPGVFRAAFRVVSVPYERGGRARIQGEGGDLKVCVGFSPL